VTCSSFSKNQTAVLCIFKTCLFLLWGCGQYIHFRRQCILWWCGLVFMYICTCLFVYVYNQTYLLVNYIQTLYVHKYMSMALTNSACTFMPFGSRVCTCMRTDVHLYVHPYIYPYSLQQQLLFLETVRFSGNHIHIKWYFSITHTFVIVDVPT